MPPSLPPASPHTHTHRDTSDNPIHFFLWTKENFGEGTKVLQCWHHLSCKCCSFEHCAALPSLPPCASGPNICLRAKPPLRDILISWIALSISRFYSMTYWYISLISEFLEQLLQPSAYQPLPLEMEKAGGKRARSTSPSSARETRSKHRRSGTKSICFSNFLRKFEKLLKFS